MIRAGRTLLEALDQRTLQFATAYEVLPSRSAEADRVLNGGFEDWTGGVADKWSSGGSGDTSYSEETSL